MATARSAVSSSTRSTSGAGQGAGHGFSHGVGQGVGEDGRIALPWLAAPVADALTRNSPALLLVGPPGVGHLEAGLALAQSWLCEAPGRTAFEDLSRQRRALACGRCGACHLSRSRLHPDLRVVVPLAVAESLGWAAAEADGEGGAGDTGKAAKASKGGRDIRIADLRAAIDWTHQTPSRSGVKVLLLHPAERLNATSANALLKTLEEPPGSVRIVLTAADPDALLPTVRSRCQRLLLPAPDPAAAREWVSRHLGVQQPQELLAAAGGTPLQAHRWLAAGWTPSLWRALPAAVRRGRAPAELGAWPLPLTVEALMAVCHDLQRTAAGGAPRYFEPEALPAGADAAALARWWQALQRASRQSEHPWNASLLVDSLLIQGQRCWA